MTHIYYMGLEPYEERYTLQLEEWNASRFKEKKIPYTLVHGGHLSDDKEIKTGQVLDAHGRTYWSLTQVANLVKIMESGKITSEDVIFFEDLFTPGYEALPYIFNQIPKEQKPKVFTRCLAQSIDPDDFVFPWRNWMRPFEQIVDQTVDGILMANTEMGWHMRVGMLNKAPLYVTGLPFDKFEVRSRVQEIKPLNQRTKRVAYSSRFDKEKQPWFYMDMIERYHNENSHIPLDQRYQFSIMTGSKNLRSTNQEYVDRATELANRGLVTIYTGLKKNQYYELLADSRLQFNCARQDWQSNTLNEASALGTPSLCPAFRSFPEALNNSATHLYSPWSLDDCMNKFYHLMSLDHDPEVSYAADDQHQCIDRTIEILLGHGEKYRYAG